MTNKLLKNRWHAPFLDVFAKTGNVSTACNAAGINRTTAYNHKKTDPEFAEAWEASLEEAGDLLEAEAWRRAREGYEVAQFYKGAVCGHVRMYSDNLLMFLLKGIRPEKFREKVMLSPAELDRLVDQELNARAGVSQGPLDRMLDAKLNAASDDESSDPGDEILN